MVFLCIRLEHGVTEWGGVVSEMERMFFSDLLDTFEGEGVGIRVYSKLDKDYGVCEINGEPVCELRTILKSDRILIESRWRN